MFGKKAKLSSVPVAFEAKPELKDIVLKLISEAVFPRVLPLTVDNLERYILHKVVTKDREREQYNVLIYKPIHAQTVHVASI